MSAAAAPQGAPICLRSPAESDTLRWGALLARAIEPLLATRARALVVALSGPLGAGKTTLVRGLLAEFGVTGPVRSPSYALLENYDTPRCHALHVDLYRLGEASEIEGLGLRDFDQPGYLWLVEWPERAGRLLAVPDVRLQLSIEPDHHAVALAAGSEDGLKVLRQLRMLLPG